METESIKALAQIVSEIGSIAILLLWIRDKDMYMQRMEKRYELLITTIVGRWRDRDENEENAENNKPKAWKKSPDMVVKD